MKYFNVYYIKIYFVISSFILVFTSCSSLNKFPYALTLENKHVIRETFVHGTVSCTNGYCWHLIRSSDQGSKLTLEGDRILFMTIKLVAEQKKPNRFDVQIVVKNLGFRMGRIEKLFLKELQNELFDANRPELIKEVEKELEKVKQRSDQSKLSSSQE